MSKGKFISIVILLVISLLAILFFQFNWISDINKLNSDRFDKDIKDVLFDVNRRLEEKEIINLTKDNLQAQFKINRSTESGQIELIESTFIKKTIDEDDNVVIRGDDGKWVQTGEKISQRSPDILQDSLKISDLEQQDRMNDASAGIIADPHSMVGGSVYRRFKKPRYKKKYTYVPYATLTIHRWNRDV